MCKIKIRLLSLFILSVIHTAAHASPCYLMPYQPWRLIFSVGGGGAITSTIGSSAYFPITNSISGEYYNYTATTSSNTKAILDLYFAGEFEVQTGLLLQLGVGYMQPNSFTAKGQFVQGTDAVSQNTYEYQYKVLARQLLFEAKLLVLGNAEQKFHPYLLAGGGVSNNNTYDYSTNVPATLTFTRTYASKVYNAPSFIVGGGVEFDVHEQVRLGFGYRYAGLGKTTLGNSTIDGTPVSGTLYQSNLNVNEIISQLTLRF
jgi:opacity protein-like surface antigen